jgi:hypothetical protein
MAAPAPEKAIVLVCKERRFGKRFEVSETKLAATNGKVACPSCGLPVRFKTVEQMRATTY